MEDKSDVDFLADRFVAPRQAQRARCCEYRNGGTRCVSQRFKVHTGRAATRTPPEDFMTVMTEPKPQSRKLSEFRNEPLTDFSKPQNGSGMETALQKVKGEIGREYPLVIGGQKITGLKTFTSINPSHKEQVLGRFQKGTREHVEQAIDVAGEAVESWERAT